MTTTSIEQTIEQIELLYRSVTGRERRRTGWPAPTISPGRRQ
jgi:hypothetical protein